MFEFVIYQIKVAAILLAFYLLYRALMGKETFHRLNRLLLLGIMALSFTLPLCVLTFHKEMPFAEPAESETAFVENGNWDVAGNAPSAIESAISQEFGADNVSIVDLLGLEESSVPGTGSDVQAVGVQSANFNIRDYLLPVGICLLVAVWLAGALYKLIRLLISVVSVWKTIRRGRLETRINGVSIVIAGQKLSPFSWMNTIVISESDYRSERGQVMIDHEMAHIMHRHSLDILLTDILMSMQWFNPVSRLLRASLQEVHEFQADNAVLNHGFDAKSYQYMILGEAMAMNGYCITNNFNMKNLSDRIKMMNRKESPIARSLKSLFVPLLTICILMATAVTVYDCAPAANAATVSNDSVVSLLDSTSVIEGRVTAGLRFVGYMAYVYDKSFEKVEKTVRIMVDDHKNFRKVFNYAEPRLVSLRAISDEGSLCNVEMPLLLLPGETVQLKMMRNECEFVSEEGYYKQYGDAIDLFSNASRYYSDSERKQMICQYFIEHSAEEGCVMAYINEGIMSTNEILNHVDKSVVNGRLKPIFDAGLLGRKFSKVKI